jgi:copper homeostasis protein
MLVEVIACTFDDAVVAKDAGADRVELCLAIEVGGLTPYRETIRQCATLAPFPVAVMVRPSPGGFRGQSKEILQQINAILSLGLNNLQIVTGALTQSNELDISTLRQVRQAVNGIPLICHRCFDLTPDPFVALEQLIDLGFDRVLTSGQEVSAFRGVEVISKLQTQAAGRIEVLPGSGIRPNNVQEIIQATGVSQVHASCFGDPVEPVSKIDFGPTLEVDVEKVLALVSAAKSGDNLLS